MFHYSNLYYPPETANLSGSHSTLVTPHCFTNYGTARGQRQNSPFRLLDKGRRKLCAAHSPQHRSCTRLAGFHLRRVLAKRVGQLLGKSEWVSPMGSSFQIAPGSPPSASRSLACFGEIDPGSCIPPFLAPRCHSKS